MQEKEFILGLMPTRALHLEQMQSAYDSTGIHLVGLSAKQEFYPIGVDDDLGLYVFSQFLSKLTGLDTVISAKLICSFLILFSLPIFIVAIHRFLKSKPQKLVALSFLSVFTILTLFRSDVYVTAYFITALLTLFSLFLHNDKFKLSFLLLVFIALMASLANYMRSGIYIPFAMFAFAIAFYFQKKSAFKIATLLVLVGMYFLPNLIFKNQMEERNNWLKAKEISWPDRSAHPVWHSVYIGLGYVNNDYGIEYLDEKAIELVDSKKQNVVYCGAEYEQILKDEVIQIAKDSPFLIVKNLALKTLVILAYLLLILVPLFFTKNKKAFLIFIPAILFSAIPGILVVPRIAYILLPIGLAMLAVLIHYSLQKDFSIKKRKSKYKF